MSNKKVIIKKEGQSGDSLKWTPFDSKEPESAIVEKNVFSSRFAMTNKTLKEASWEKSKYIVIGGVCYLAIGDDVELNVRVILDEDNKPTDDTVREGMPTMVLLSSKFRSVQRGRSLVTGVVVMVKSNVEVNEVNRLENCMFSRVDIKGDTVSVVKCHLSFCKLQGKRITLKHTRINSTRIITERFISISDTVSNSVFEKISGWDIGANTLQVKLTKIKPGSMIRLPVFNNPNVNVVIKNKIDFGSFSGIVNIPFVRSDMFDIMVGDAYFTSKLFTLVAQRFCNENHLSHYTFNGLEMFSKDMDVNGAELTNQAYQNIIAKLGCLALDTKSFNYSRDKSSANNINVLWSLIHQIRSRINTYKDVNYFI